MASGPQNNPTQTPLLKQQARQNRPMQVARTISDHVRAGLIVTAWLVLAAFGLAAAWICLRGILWAAKLAQTGLGI